MPDTVPRDLHEVIGKILEVVPIDKIDFRFALKARQSSVRYSAPESIGHWWWMTADTMYEFIPNPPETDWQKEAVAIWMNEK